MESIIVVMSLMGNVMLLFYWLLRPVAEKYFTVGWKYAVLKITLIFYIVPIPELKSIIMLIVDIMSERFSFESSGSVSLRLEQAIQVRSNELVALPIKIPILMIFTIVWLIGFIVILFCQVFSYIKARKFMCENAVLLSDAKILEVFEYLKKKAGIKRKVKVLISNNVNTPVTMGLFSTVIILPTVRFETNKLEYILEHELIHIKHNDFLFRLSAVFVSGLHWFNPFAFFLMKEIGYVCEYACDESVVLDKNENQIKEYGHTILDVSALSIMDKGQGKVLINSFANYNKKAMKARLSNMKSIKRTKRGMRILSGVIGLALTMMSMMTVFAYDEPKLVKGDNVNTETTEMVTAMFSKGEVDSQQVVLNADAKLIKVMEYFVDQKGDYKIVSGNMLDDERALCIHKFEDGEYVRHTLYSNGSCKEEYYNAKMCAYCNRIEVGTKFNTITYAVCIH